MKILWFTNTPSLAAEKIYKKVIFGGWISALEKQIKKNTNIKLGIAFYSDIKSDPFNYKGTIYYPILKKEDKLINYKKRIFNLLEPINDIDIYKKIINDFSPDLVHIHGLENPFGLIQKYINNIPMVVSIQGSTIVYNFKWYSGVPKELIFKYSKFIDKILFNTFISHQKTFAKRAKREAEIFQYTKNIIGRTDWDKRITSVLAYNSRYFHNDEILRESFYKNKWGQNFELPFKIFTTLRPAIYKGLETVFLSANILDKLGVNYKWLIAGVDENNKIVDIITKAFSIKVSKNIIFKGILDENELITELLHSHLYIMPSHIENSPNGLCEAMLLGMPCIATNVGGTSSLLSDKTDGILVQDGDPWAMSGAILELYNNYDIAIQYGINARNKALVRHDPNKIVNELINIYKEILNT